MKLFFVIFISLLSFGSSADEISSDDLSTLSECDYFKYNTCTSGGLNIGACVKAKYDGFVKACGKIHADNYTYSREMFKPTIDPKKKNNKNCEATQSKLCSKSGLSLSSCASKFGDELKKACGQQFIKGATSKAVMKIDECFALRKKTCGNSVDPDCEVIFQAKAPALCKGVTPKTKSGMKGSPSDQTMMNDCMGTIKTKCKIDEKELMKDGVDVNEYMRKYQECTKRALKNSTGKCGNHFDVDKKVKKFSK